MRAGISGETDQRAALFFDLPWSPVTVHVSRDREQRFSGSARFGRQLNRLRTSLVNGRGRPMPTQRLSMRRIKEVLRLKHIKACRSEPSRAPWASATVPCTTISPRAEAAGLNWPVPAGMSDEDLELLLFPAPKLASQSPQRPVPDWGYVDKERRRRNVTRRLLRDEYRRHLSDGFGYTWFCTSYEAWKGRTRPSMRQTHLGGEKVFVDFAGDTSTSSTPRVGNAVDEAVRRRDGCVQLYLRRGLPKRGARRLDAGPRQRLPRRRADIRGLRQSRGRGHQSDRHDPGLNRTYAEMASHYGTAVLAARRRRPKEGKGRNCSASRQRWILARLRNQRFFSLAELNAAIKILAVELNARQMRDFGASRAELFAELDKPKLTKLPDQAYAFARWKRCRVGPDYHIEIDRHWYSAPYRLIRELVDARIDDCSPSAPARQIEGFCGGRISGSS